MIDAASFTSVRIISGAVMLGLIVLPRLRSQGRPKVDLRAVAMLFAYMIFFSSRNRHGPASRLQWPVSCTWCRRE